MKIAFALGCNCYLYTEMLIAFTCNRHFHLQTATTLAYRLALVAQLYSNLSHLMLLFIDMPDFRVLSRYILAILFMGAGVLHFVAPATYLRIMPPYLPEPLLLVYVSGAAEIAGGVGLLVPATRRLAGWELILLLLAVFPANVYMLQAHGAGMAVPLWALWLRLPLQAVLIVWVWWSARGKPMSLKP